MSTFYVSHLNPDAQTLDELGLFTGQITPDEEGLYTVVVPIPLADIKSHFKFKCETLDNPTGDNMNDVIHDIDITGLAGVTGATDAAWTFPARGVAAADGARSNFVGLLAQKVFGSLGAADLFSNRAALESAWHDAAADALVSLKAKTHENGVIASKQLIDAMFYAAPGVGAEKGIRFSMAYDAATDLALTPSTPAENVSVTGASGSGAFVNVTAEGISVKTTGSAYAAGGVVTIGALSFTINSVQAAMLNGQLDQPTEVPLIVGDKIQVIYQINSDPAQEDVSGDLVSVAQRFKVEYEMTA